MEVDGVETESTANFLEGFEPAGSGQKIIWCGREVQVFSWDRRYSSAGIHDNPWRNGPSYNPSWEVEQRCNCCNSDLVDFFWDYQWNYTCFEKIGMIFFRTCVNCFDDEERRGKIFGRYKNWIHETYIIPIEDSLRFVPDYIDNPNLIQKTFFQRLQAFIDNFDTGQADINDAIIAGLFRSFGIVRDSVDFFVAVGDYLKEKLGIDKEKEKDLYDENIEPSEETRNALKDVARASPLDIFRRIFPTGREIQKACFDTLGIKYEPDTPIKRVLEEFGAAGPFGLVWMAVCTGGQVAVESGLIKESVKPFYEIVFALLTHKAINISKTIPTALEVKEMSHALIEAEIDIGKIKAGNLAELKRANNEITSFLDAREFQPTKNTVVPFEDSKIPITLASDTWGWKVGDSINNRTLLGDVPKWSTVRSRYWKNKALDHQAGRIEGELKYEMTEENIARMERGLTPQTLNKNTGEMESIELHHEPPQREGGLFDFIEVTAEEHANMDEYKYVKIFPEDVKAER